MMNRDELLGFMIGRLPKNLNASEGTVVRDVLESVADAIAYGEHKSNDDSMYEKYINTILEYTGDDKAVPRYINKQLYDAIFDDTFDKLTIYYRHGDGATLSALSAAKVFDDVLYVTTHGRDAKHLSKLFGVDSVTPSMGMMEPVYDKVRQHRVLICDNTEFGFLRYGRPEFAGKRIITLIGHDK